MALNICNQYLDALNEGNLEKVLRLFSENSVVISPLYGVVDATEFYGALFEDTNRSETKLLDIFQSSTRNTSIALHFQYNWTLKNGKAVEFQCVDVFELTANKRQFQKLTIIYDTGPFHKDFNEMHKTNSGSVPPFTQNKN